MDFFSRSPVVVDVVDWGLEFAAGAAHKIGERLLDCCELATRFFVCIGSNDVDAGHRVRMFQLFGRLEFSTVDFEGREKISGREVRGEGVRQSECRSEFGAESA